MQLKKEIIDFFFNEKELRVFAYGSLMWRPDFDFKSISKADIYGYKRFWGIPSVIYRGTSQFHGLVLALQEIDENHNFSNQLEISLTKSIDNNRDELWANNNQVDSCQGLLFRIDDHDSIVSICDKLWEREMTYDVYVPKVVDIFCHDSKKSEKALTFTVNHDHPKNIIDIDDMQAIERICLASGVGGSNFEYFINTEKMFKQFGIKDTKFETFLAKLKKHHEKTKHK